MSALCRRRSAPAPNWIGLSLVLLGSMFMWAPPARAQFAVIDIASLTQLIEQASTLLQQLNAARTQIAQAQSLFRSMTGPRGMQQLLNTASLNYLPTDLDQLSAAELGRGGGYVNLAAAISNAEMANAVMSPAQLSSLSIDEQSSINGGRRAAALLQGVTDQALSDSSNRFTDIKTLISAIPAAADQKAMLELQAAIGTEIGVLQNEQSKLQALYQVANAQERSNRQKNRELIVIGHGRFQGRFEPTPP
jgi:type IV secretion system protein VirB5